MAHYHREQIIVALLEGVAENRKFQVRTFLTQMFEMIANDDVKMAIPIARRVIEDIHPTSMHELATALVRYVRGHKTYSTVYDDRFHGQSADPEADYLTHLAQQFVAEWNKNHSIP